MHDSTMRNVVRNIVRAYFLYHDRIMEEYRALDRNPPLKNDGQAKVKLLQQLVLEAEMRFAQITEKMDQ